MSDVTEFRPRAVTLPGDLETLCRQWLTHLTTRGYADNTLIAYRRDLEQFVGYLAGRGVRLIQTASTRQIDEFVDALMAGEGNSPRSAARKLAVVQGLFRYAAGRGILEANPADHAEPVRFEAEPPVAPEPESVSRMIAGIPTDTALGLRDRALFLLMQDAGLRVSGLLSLDTHDPDNPPKWGVRPDGAVFYRAKGGRTEEGVCGDATLAALDAWMQVRHRLARHGSDAALFLSTRGRRMAREAVHARIKLWGAAAGMPHIHCHLIRHSRAMQIIEHLSPRHAQSLLGHKRLSTTVNTYGQGDRQRLREQIRARCPVGTEITQEVA